MIGLLRNTHVAAKAVEVVEPEVWKELPAQLFGAKRIALEQLPASFEGNRQRGHIEARIVRYHRGAGSHSINHGRDFGKAWGIPYHGRCYAGEPAHEKIDRALRVYQAAPTLQFVPAIGEDDGHLHYTGPARIPIRGLDINNGVWRSIPHYRPSQRAVDPKVLGRASALPFQEA